MYGDGLDDRLAYVAHDWILVWGTPTRADVRLEWTRNVRGSDGLLRAWRLDALRRRLLCVNEDKGQKERSHDNCTALELASTFVLFMSSDLSAMCITRELYIEQLFNPLAKAVIYLKNHDSRFQILVDSLAL